MKINNSKKILLLLFLVSLSFFSLLYIFYRPKPGLVIENTSPTDKSSVKSLSAAISLIFKNPISQATQRRTSIQISPNFKFRLLWDSPTILSVLPEEKLTPSSTYHITLYLDNNPQYKFSFSTPFGIQPSEYPSLIEQGKEDTLFAQSVQKTVESLPFLTKLPIITNQYTIVYDFEKSRIRIRLHFIERSKVEAEITQKLKEIGVDPKKVPIFFTN